MSGLFGSSSVTSSGSTPTASTALTIQTAVAGIPIAFLYGTNRIGSNIIYFDDFYAVAQTSSSSSSGGKGGGGGGGSSVTGYKYYATLILALCAGPIWGVRSVWDSKTQLGDLSAIGGSTFWGQHGQGTWSYMSGAHAATALGYSGLAYIGAANTLLGTSATMPTWTFEVCGRLAESYGGDANFADVITDVLTDPYIGVGLAADQIADLSIYRSWCASVDLKGSPYSNSQSAARDYIRTWLDATCANAFWSAGQIKILPYGDANPGAYAGSLTPVLSFGSSDYMPADGSPPVEIDIIDPSDLYNRFSVEYAGRWDSYNTHTVISDDPAHISTYGLRAEGAQSWHFVTREDVAQRMVDLRRSRALGVMATYQFRLGAVAAVLEPMDIIAITDPTTGLLAYPVRITKIEEVSDSLFGITAEDVPGEMLYDATRPTTSTTGYASGYGAAPGRIATPVIFEPPLGLAGDLEVWISATSASTLWGGCHVWLSLDGETYSRIGTIPAPARQGVLTKLLPAGASVDTIHDAAVTLVQGSLTSVSAADWIAGSTLTYIDGEIIAYQTATLTGAKAYDLTALRRGLYGSTIAAHGVGSAFARIDDRIFKYPITADQIGQTAHLKFTSYNIYGAAEEDLADVPVYTIRIAGSALTTRLPDVSGLTTSYTSGILQLSWDAYNDTRSLDTEIRVGPTWSSAQVLTRTTARSIASQGDGTYWLAAHITVGTGADAIDLYSQAPAEVVIAGSQLVANVIASHDEQAAGWPGATSGVVQIGSSLKLCGQGSLIDIADLSSIVDLPAFGGMIGSGLYQVPASHRVNVGRVATCQVVMSTAATGQSIYDDLSKIPDLTQDSDLSGASHGPSISARPMLRLSQDGVTWGGWQAWQAGSYTAQEFDFGLMVASSAADVTAVVTAFTAAVDVPDRNDTYSVSSAATGVTVVFDNTFNGGPGSAALPAVSATIVSGGAAGDTVQISGLTLSGCTVTVYSSSAVAVAGRSVHLIVQGY